MSWDFTMANYDAVWAFMVQLGLLLMFLMLGNILRRKRLSRALSSRIDESFAGSVGGKRFALQSQ